MEMEASYYEKALGVPTQKYRAFCYLKGTTLVVFDVNDHQQR